MEFTTSELMSFAKAVIDLRLEKTMSVAEACARVLAQEHERQRKMVEAVVNLQLEEGR